MATLLRIDASARTEESHSRSLADEVEATWLRANPDGTIYLRDLAREPVAHIKNETINGFYTPPNEMTDALRKATALSDALINQLLSADTLLISTPMYNFSVPAVLKAWIDQVVRINHTFSYDPDNGFAGLIKNKTAYIATAIGAQFSDTPFEAYDFLRPYLNKLFGFMGFEKIRIFSIESTSIDELQMAKTRREAIKQIRDEFNETEEMETVIA